MMMLVRPAATASSMTYWMIGLSTRGGISLGCALVAGRKRVPQPAAGKTALRTRIRPLEGEGEMWPVYRRVPRTQRWAPDRRSAGSRHPVREPRDEGGERARPVEVA